MARRPHQVQSKRTLGQLLEQNGYEVTEFVGVGRLPLLWKSMIMVARSLSDLSGASVLQAESSAQPDDATKTMPL